MTTYIELGSGGSSDFISSFLDSGTIDLDVLAAQLQAELILSPNAAAAGFLKVTSTKETNGLLSVVPHANGSTTGVITSTDWTAFDSKPETIAELIAATAGGNAATGAIGEVLIDNQAPTIATVAATGVFGPAVSITLTPGAFEITGLLITQHNDAILTTSISGGICDTTNGASLTQYNTAEHDRIATSSSASQNFSFVVPPLVVSHNISKTYYLNSRFYYSGGTPKHGGRLTARRIR
jgi:hypothetical protein